MDPFSIIGWIIVVAFAAILLGKDDVIDLSRNENFKVMCWETNHWNFYPLNKMTVESKGNCINLTNSIYVHNHVKVVYDKIISGDFKAEIELQGDFRSITLMGTDGQDRAISCKPDEQGIDTKTLQKFIISRKGDEINVTVSGQRLHVENSNASYDMKCYIGISVSNGKTVKLCSLKVG